MKKVGKSGRVPKPHLRTRHLSSSGKSAYGAKAPAFHPSAGVPKPGLSLAPAPTASPMDPNIAFAAPEG